MKQFPFHTKPKFNPDFTEHELVTVGNEIVGTIQIPSIGSWTVNEALAFDKLLAEIDAKVTAGEPRTYRQLQVGQVGLILRSRKPEFEGWTDLEIVECIPLGLLELLYQFTEQEFKAWQPTETKPKGDEANQESLGESGPVVGDDSPPSVLTNDSILPTLEINPSGSLPEKSKPGNKLN